MSSGQPDTRLSARTLEVLRDIRRTGEGFQCSTVLGPNGVTFGAHHLFTQVVIAEMAAPGKRVLNLSTVFAWGGRGGEPIDVSVDTLQSGRSFSFLTLTYRQGDRVLTRAEALLTVDEPDHLSYTDAGRPTVDMHEWPVGDMGELWPGISHRNPVASIQDSTSWYHTETPITDPSEARGLMALATEMGVLGTLGAHDQTGAIRPRQGHVNVLAQSIALFEAADLHDGIVVRASARYAGRGRANGDGTIADTAGRLVGTFSTTAVARGNTA